MIIYFLKEINDINFFKEFLVRTMNILKDILFDNIFKELIIKLILQIIK